MASVKQRVSADSVSLLLMFRCSSCSLNLRDFFWSGTKSSIPVHRTYVRTSRSINDVPDTQRQKVPRYSLLKAPEASGSGRTPPTCFCLQDKKTNKHQNHLELLSDPGLIQVWSRSGWDGDSWVILTAELFSTFCSSATIFRTFNIFWKLGICSWARSS